ncbi:hypothetical protein KDA11_02260 [Candidatus Saccharibacteria bacterium]|nr:hypothetical protein [Candidatus Saccharibacteria bacterium]
MAKKDQNVFNSSYFKAIQGVTGIIFSWLVFIRAVDTGSLQQYGILIILIIFSINRLFRTVISKK